MRQKHLCPYCGIEIKIVNKRWFCVNCGFIDEELDPDENKRRSYFE